jgi:hypothetical protein
MLSICQGIKATIDAFSLEKYRQEISETKKILDGLKEGKGVISDEDFKKLSEYSAEVADMFTLTADGYQFIGGGSEAENREKIKKLESITAKTAAEDAQNQLKRIDYAEKAKDTLKLNQEASASDFADMIEVSKSSKYKDFLAASGLSAETLMEMGY